MTQNKQATLLDSIQSEVSREASPILEFLVNNSRKIFMGLTLFVLLVLGFGIFTYYTVSQQRSAQEALGKILIMPESAAKITQLEAFAASGKPELKTAALMALANSASLQNLPDKAAQAWGEPRCETGARLELKAGIGGKENEA